MNHTLKSSAKNIVFFDGECVVCNGFFRFLLNKDKHKNIHFATLQSESAQNFFKQNIKDKKIPDSILFWQNDQMYMRSDAALRSVATLGGVWKIAKGFLIFPKFLRDIVYDFIARNRYRWWKKKACLIPEPGWNDRFIDKI